MNVYILTLPIGTNYGEVMQAYALRKSIEQMGHNAITIRAVQNDTPFLLKIIHWFGVVRANLIYRKNLYHALPEERCKISYHNLETFIDKHIKTTNFIRIHNDPQKLSDLPADIFVVGSDQVWRPGRISWKTYDAYFLGFLKSDIKRISYAASFGHDNVKLPPYAKRKYAVLLKKFSFVSVREYSGVEICRREFGVDAKVVLDPTMLLPRTDYDEIADSYSSSASEKPYCFEYVLDKTQFKDSVVNAVSQNLKVPRLSILPKGNISDSSSKAEDCVLPPVEEWLNGIRNAKFVVTDSFHGTVFSILFHTPFCVLGNKRRGATRIKSILGMFGLESRFVDSAEQNAIESVVNAEIDWQKVDSILAEKREMSLTLLQNALG